ncbi:MAG: hypothetical protein JXK05_11225 [Campylobacterales bacterium]|nr:hypothetical protein [Campylobacterales bacterium]
MREGQLIVCGIGASAGGLEALQELVHNLPSDQNIAYIIAQHLSPSHKSLMVDLLSKSTEKEVLEAQNGLLLRRDTIYITPPNFNLTVLGEIIQLKAPALSGPFPKPSIDVFFTSLAMAKGARCIGIILSGTGSDGAQGLGVIKAEGGITIAQDPKSAKYDGMPNAAIRTGNVDIILPPAEIAQEISDILEYIDGKLPLSKILSTPTDYFERLFLRIKQVKGVDFSHYKRATLSRRLQRRMAALKYEEIEDYVSRVESDDDEVSKLFADILIGVTSFFRDGEVLGELVDHFMKLLSTKNEGDVVRIWDVGCSSGQEIHSLLMLLESRLGAAMKSYTFQVFATDVDEASLQKARDGVYSVGAVADVPPPFLERYFTRSNDTFRIKKQLRDMVLFSRHDVISDPPFLRLDLIVCRNLLIYFNQELQRELFPLFHYALNNSALLLLGHSESIGIFGHLFGVKNAKSRIYYREYAAEKSIPRSVNLRLGKGGYQMPPPQRRKRGIDEMMTEVLGSYFMPQSVVINDVSEIIYIKERNPYIQFAPGAMSANIFKCVHPDLSLELRTVLHQCIKNHRPQRSDKKRIALDEDHAMLVSLVVLPMDVPDETSRLYIVSFVDEKAEPPIEVNVGDAQKMDALRLAVLERELETMRVHLQSVIEELETSNEELQSTNEELQSTNEELQSTNEELETSNEELQSTNEELQIAYTELSVVSKERELHQREAEERAAQLSVLNEQLHVNEERLELRVKEEVAKQRAQEQLLIQQSKMAAMGEMIGAIAHNWRQPLNVVALQVQQIQERYERALLDEVYVARAVEQSMKQIRFMSETIDDFRNFFKPTEASARFSLLQSVEKTFLLLKAQFDSHGIETRIEIDPSLHVSGSENQMRQALINILLNAKDAIDERRLDGDEAYEPLIVVSALGEEERIALRIWDNALEVEEQILERAFEPYFTTKEPGKGTGTGLYMTQVIVTKNMQGSVEAANREGGFEIVMRLPHA